MNDTENEQSNEQTETPPEKSPQYERFESGLRRALAVPKQEIDKRQAAYESKRAAVKREKT